MKDTYIGYDSFKYYFYQKFEEGVTVHLDRRTGQFKQVHSPDDTEDFYFTAHEARGIISCGGFKVVNLEQVKTIESEEFMLEGAL